MRKRYILNIKNVVCNQVKTFTRWWHNFCVLQRDLNYLSQIECIEAIVKKCLSDNYLQRGTDNNHHESEAIMNC